ncbi:hypothetical protein RRG08_039712 [Elysia crispata]|uniref:Uncharacterized protein n=1 Tax=Elysia crispata TaxID=231223 RepID=A0AAE0YB40_9GAST|nr:hypothetical protein RRG08_039712 [Elysia crispata]
MSQLSALTRVNKFSGSKDHTARDLHCTNYRIKLTTNENQQVVDHGRWSVMLTSRDLNCTNTLYSHIERLQPDKGGE